MSHNILTGLWKQKKWNPKNLFKFIHEMTPAQLSFCREVVNQNLGNPPSKYWGHEKINIKLKQNKKALQYFLEATSHPKHIMSAKLSEHKEAAGYASAIGEAVVTGAKAFGRTAVKAGKYLAAHAGTIVKGVGTALQLGATGVQLAASVGLLDPESDATLIGLSNMTNQIASTYHAEKAEQAEAKKAAEKGTDKKGESLRRAHEAAQKMAVGLHKMNLTPAPRPKWVKNEVGNYVFGYGPSGTETKQEALEKQRKTGGSFEWPFHEPKPIPDNVRIQSRLMFERKHPAERLQRLRRERRKRLL